MNRKRSASRNRLIAGQAGISYGGFIFGQAVRFAFNMAVARMLVAEALGVYPLALAVKGLDGYVGGMFAAAGNATSIKSRAKWIGTAWSSGALRKMGCWWASWASSPCRT